MKSFYTLTNRGRALRLRRMALAALERYDLEVERVRLITNDLNGIFRVDAAEGGKFILRVSLPDPGGHTLAEIRSEAMWLEALRRDTTLGVPRPLAARDGAYVTTVEVDGDLPATCPSAPSSNSSPQRSRSPGPPSGSINHRWATWCRAGSLVMKAQVGYNDR